jgi:phosphohistidine phosphatase
MQLLIVRHGPAEPVSARHPRDFDRPLTTTGSALVSKAAASLPRLFEPPVELLTSPARRARETADRLARALRARAEPRAELAPGAELSEVLEWLEQLAPVNRRVLVSHQPLVSQLVGELVVGEPRTVAAQEPGSAVALETDTPLSAGGAHLLWAFTLNELAAMATGQPVEPGLGARAESANVARTEGKRGRSTTTATRP